MAEAMVDNSWSVDCPDSRTCEPLWDTLTHPIVARRHHRLLVEQEITMVEQENGQMELIKSRAELASPTTDWETSWRRARLKGIGSDGTSFLWKMLHNLLPTEARLSRILPNSSEQCKLCPAPATADLTACLPVSAPGRLGTGYSPLLGSMTL